MRKLWTDGWNSFWHFTFGALTYKIPVIMVIFLVYQGVAKHGLYERNVSVDILEYFIGLISMMAASFTIYEFYEIPHELFTEVIPEVVLLTI
jgi:hypothetical protein